MSCDSFSNDLTFQRANPLAWCKRLIRMVHLHDAGWSVNAQDEEGGCRQEPGAHLQVLAWALAVLTSHN